VGLVVNRGPRVAAAVFGPATAAVLALLWVLVVAVIARDGVRLPSLDRAAFDGAHLHATFGGYVRLLALMTGIEVFANLVAAYDGTPEVRARRAFGSLLIVMVTTLVTMVIVGPAIFELADPMRDDVSVFTQAMDRLLPPALAYAGTLIGIVVLLSAAAASAQGLQNLALGLRYRHYVPAVFGQRNRFDVADRPVVIQALLVCGCFLAFGTSEETYLTLYAAGVFVLLGLTGWASVKRLWRERRMGRASSVPVLGTVLAAFITSAAAALIFFERFSEGAWAYLVLVPALYYVFSWFRRRLGAPAHIEERLGATLAESKSFIPTQVMSWPQAVLAVSDGSQLGEAALVAGAELANKLAAELSFCVVDESPGDLKRYLGAVQRTFLAEGGASHVASAAQLAELVGRAGADLLVVAREAAAAREAALTCERPVLLVRASVPATDRYPSFERALFGLDGSSHAECVLPYCVSMLRAGTVVLLLGVPEGDTSSESLQKYIERMAAGLSAYGTVSGVVAGSGPARTIVERADQDDIDLVVVSSHGGGGVARADAVPLGSVPERLLSELACPLLIVPATATSR
jgi:nucleotide-binding universal stress UspA family protein